MKEHTCESCNWQAKYDAKPKSILGRIWRWHATWCPGWNKYMRSLSVEKRDSIVAQYHMQDRYGS
jgi:hypothetical protein